MALPHLDQVQVTPEWTSFFVRMDTTDAIREVRALRSLGVKEHMRSEIIFQACVEVSLIFF